MLSQSIDALSSDRLVARATPGSKGAVEAVLTVGPRFLLKERAPLKGTQALSANEVVDVPFLVESSDATIKNGLITVGTSGTKQLLVTFLTMRESILLIEVVSAKRVLAISTHKMFWVICIAKCLNDLSKDRVAAVSACASGCWGLVVNILHLSGEVL